MTESGDMENNLEKHNSADAEIELTQEQIRKAFREIIHRPALFCRKLLGLEPYPYQVKFLEDKSMRIIACAGRQVGKSLITAARALWFGTTCPNTTTLIVSPSLAQSMNMFNKVLDYVEESDVLMRSVVRKTRTMIKLSNGSVIRALPCGPYGKMLRGNSADLIIVDEAAYVPEAIITDVAMPMLAAKNGRMILISSPCDKDHFFYRAFNSEHWSKYHFKTADNPLVARSFLEEAREDIGEVRFRREYLAEFVDDDRTYFPMALLRTAVHVCGGNSCGYCSIISGSAQASGDLYAGYDPGGMMDPAALVVVQRAVVEEEEAGKKDDAGDGKSVAAKKKKLVFRVVLSKTFALSREEKKRGIEEGSVNDIYTRFTLEVSDLHQKIHFRKLLVDSTGLGSPIVSHCKELKLPAEGVTLSTKTNEEILSNLKILTEQKRVEFPENLELLSHLNSITAKRTRMGSYTFDHPKGTHDDLAYALALAVWGARTRPVTILMNAQ
ncbi:MAG: terminase large subunit domain-containing protein [Nitrososphaerales archaeon]